MPLLRGGQEHPLFGSRAFHLIVVDNEFLLQNLDGIQAVCLLLFRQHYFTEVSFSEYRKEVKVIQPDLPFSN